MSAFTEEGIIEKLLLCIGLLIISPVTQTAKAAITYPFSTLDSRSSVLDPRSWAHAGAEHRASSIESRWHRESFDFDTPAIFAHTKKNTRLGWIQDDSVTGLDLAFWVPEYAKSGEP